MIHMIVNPRLSDNFRYSELDCPCCHVCMVKRELIGALQLLREQVGRPITITSGYRCPKHNQEIGGVPFSKHTLGQAADIVIAGLSPQEMYLEAAKIPAFFNGGIGVYLDRGFIHVDVRAGSARWAEQDGKRIRYFDRSQES